MIVVVIIKKYLARTSPLMNRRVTAAKRNRTAAQSEITQGKCEFGKKILKKPHMIAMLVSRISILSQPGRFCLSLINSLLNRMKKRVVEIMKRLPMILSYCCNPTMFSVKMPKLFN